MMAVSNGKQSREYCTDFINFIIASLVQVLRDEPVSIPIHILQNYNS
jgi:hypothetical protein